MISVYLCYSQYVSDKSSLSHAKQQRQIRRNNMKERVTIQDIADALGVSRNTVSKAINNTGVLAEATREKVLKKAVEMGYKQFSYINLAKDRSPLVSLNMADEKPAPAGMISLLTTRFLSNSHFSSTMLDRVQRELSFFGYSFSIHHVSDEDLASRRLPRSLDLSAVSGIVCVEVFDYAYSLYLCSLEVPILFVDGPAPVNEDALPSDMLVMNNRTGIYAFIREMKNRGKTKIGFVGDYLHCTSFYERYLFYRNAMYTWGLPIDEHFVIGPAPDLPPYPHPDDYQKYLFYSLKKMGKLPEVFFCANDFVAIDLLQCLRKMDVRVPEDVYLCGFDDSPESRVITPRLTTIHIHSQVMGYSAAHLLLSRIKYPTMNYRTIYTETSLIYRESTGD